MVDEPAPAPAPVGSAAEPVTPPRPSARPRRPLLLALLVEARPKQWVKNVLVFAAPGAAGVLDQRQDAASTRSIAFVVLLPGRVSGTYFLNDAADVEADRLHPKKRFRPIAAGEIPRRPRPGARRRC